MSDKQLPAFCDDCGEGPIEARPFSDYALCKSCGYRYLGVPRNPTYSQEWSGDEYERCEVLRE